MSRLDYLAQTVAVDGDMKALDDFAALADEVQGASQEMRKKACLAACRLAVTRTGLQFADIDEVLQLLEASRPVLPKLRKRLSKLAEDLDEKYLTLGDAVDSGAATEKECDDAFSLARAAAAVCFAVSAFSEQSSEEIEESIYEAVEASGQDRAFIASIREALSRSPR
jgi:hypothetical protein